MEIQYRTLEWAQSLIDELLGDSRSSKSDNHLKAIMHAVLGEELRELSDGDTFGERALEGHFVRTASVFATEDCHFMTIGADEYNAFVKIKYKNVRDAKHLLLVEKFPGYSNLPSEDIWKF